MITRVRSSIYVSCDLSIFLTIVMETKYFATDAVGSRCLKSWYIQVHVHLPASVNITWDNLDSDWNIRFWSKGLLLIWAVAWDLTMWYVRPAKPQISLHIHTVWSESLLVAWIFYECKATDWKPFGVSKVQRRLAMSVWVYTCQNATLLEITCRGSFILFISYLVGS